MTSIDKTMSGLNGDRWGTSLSEEDQLAHLEYVKKNFCGLNSAYELDREREFAAMREELGIEERNEEWNTNMKVKRKQTVDLEVFKTVIEEIKTKHSEDMKNLLDALDTFDSFLKSLDTSVTKQIADLSSKVTNLEAEVTNLEAEVTNLEAEVKKLKEPFFKKLSSWFRSLRSIFIR